jgi:tRNA(fMet)-specific endonuclease VapC
LDTSVVISLPDVTDPALLPEDPQISAITLAELAVGPKVAQDENVRKARAAQLEAVEEAFDPLPFDVDAANAFGSVSASLRDGGAKTRARSIDALIAATALANGMPLYTCNPQDFQNIDDLEVFEVPEPTRLTG